MESLIDTNAQFLLALLETIKNDAAATQGVELVQKFMTYVKASDLADLDKKFLLNELRGLSIHLVNENLSTAEKVGHTGAFMESVSSLGAGLHDIHTSLSNILSLAADCLVAAAYKKLHSGTKKQVVGCMFSHHNEYSLIALNNIHQYVASCAESQAISELVSQLKTYEIVAPVVIVSTIPCLYKFNFKLTRYNDTIIGTVRNASDGRVLKVKWKYVSMGYDKHQLCYFFDYYPKIDSSDCIRMYIQKHDTAWYGFHFINDQPVLRDIFDNNILDASECSVFTGCMVTLWMARVRKIYYIGSDEIPELHKYFSKNKGIWLYPIHEARLETLRKAIKSNDKHKISVSIQAIETWQKRNLLEELTRKYSLDL